MCGIGNGVFPIIKQSASFPSTPTTATSTPTTATSTTTTAKKSITSAAANTLTTITPKPGWMTVCNMQSGNSFDSNGVLICNKDSFGNSRNSTEV